MPGGDPVLLVDHERAVRSVIRFILEKYKIGVIEADSGAAAMERLARGGVRAVLLDTMIPDMDLEELLLHIKERYATPVALMTTGAQQRAVQRARNLGVDLVLYKPFNVDELWAGVSTLL